MSHSLRLSCAALVLIFGLGLAIAQEEDRGTVGPWDRGTESQNSKPESPIPNPEPSPTAGRYEPDNPAADADGFVWEKEGTTDHETTGPQDHGPRTTDQDRGPQKSQEKPTDDPAIGNRQSAIGNPRSFLDEGDGSEIAKSAPEKQGSMGSMVLRMVGGLGVVLGLMILGSAALKRFSAKGTFLGKKGRLWKVVESTPLGSKRTLYVTQFLDRILLLGVTDQQITVLSEIQDPTLVAAIESGDADFRRFLIPETFKDTNGSSVPGGQEMAAEAVPPKPAASSKLKGVTPPEHREELPPNFRRPFTI